MSLRAYEDARPFARLIKEMVTRRLMPPYHYDHDVGSVQDLKDDWRLSDEQIKTIEAWVDAGAPEGDPAAMPPQKEFAPYDDWIIKDYLGREPDHVVESKPFTVPAEGGDLWWRPVVPIGSTGTGRFALSRRGPATPTASKGVHHAIPRLLAKNEDGEWERVASFSEYAMGKVGEILPDDAYRILPKDGLIQWDVHYYPGGSAQDRTGAVVAKDNVVRVGFWFYEDDEVPEYEQDLELYPLRGDLVVEPGGTAMTQGFHRWDHPVRIDQYQAHGHVHLHAMSMEAIYPDGQQELLSMVTNFSAKWHHSYIYEDGRGPAPARRHGPGSHGLVRQHGEEPARHGSEPLRSAGRPHSRRDVPRLARRDPPGSGRGTGASRWRGSRRWPPSRKTANNRSRPGVERFNRTGWTGRPRKSPFGPRGCSLGHLEGSLVPTSDLK